MFFLIKNKIKPEFDKTETTLPPNLQTSKQKLLSGNGFIVNKRASKISN